MYSCYVFVQIRCCERFITKIAFDFLHLTTVDKSNMTFECVCTLTSQITIFTLMQFLIILKVFWWMI